MNKPITPFSTTVFSILLFLLLPFGNNLQACSIFDMTATVTDCNGDGNFFVVIDFMYTDPTSNTFSLVGNGNNYGDFAYTDLPVELGPFPGDDGTPWEFVAIDNEFPDCSDFVAVGEVSCATACDVDNLFIEVLSETTDGTNYLITYDGPPPTALGVDVQYNGLFIGFYPFDQLPAEVFVPCDLGSSGVITLCDNDTDCCREIVVELAGCDAGGTELTFSMPGVTAPDGTTICIPVTVSNFENIVSAQYSINYNPDILAFVGVQNLNLPGLVPVNIGNPAPGDIIFSWLANDVIHGETVADGTIIFELCFEVTCAGNNNSSLEFSGDPLAIEAADSNGLVEPLFLDGSVSVIDCNVDCAITDLIVEPYDCDGEGNFLVDLTFNHSGTSSQFKVFVNGQLYETYNYSDLFITIGPFEGNGNVYLFEVFDSEFPDCGAEVEITAPECNTGECHLTELVIEHTPCDANGQYELVIDFNHNNGSPNGFRVKVGPDVFGPYDYSLLPVSLGPFPGDGTTYQVVVRDFDDPGCQVIGTSPAVDCAADCAIFDVVYTVDCTGNGTYFLAVDFEVTNPGGASFNMIYNGVNEGDYLYSDLPIVLGPYPADGNPNQMKIRDSEIPDCKTIVEVEPVLCSDACTIFNVISEAECNDDGTYNVFIDFDYENAANDFFEVSVNGINIGLFPLAELPIVLQNVPGPVGGLVLEIEICINDAPDCCTLFTLELPDCSEPPCELSNLDIVEIDCNNDTGQFFAVLDFDHVGTGSAGFKVTINGVNYGVYDYADLPVAVGPIPADGADLLVSVRDFDDPTCRVILEAPGVLCTDECVVYDLNVSVECNANDHPVYTIDFNYANPGSDFYSVTIDGTSYGEFPLDGTLLTLTDVPGNPGDVLEVVVCIVDAATDCCATTEVEVPDCEAPPCMLSGLEVVEIECTDNGTFFAVLNFNYVSEGDNGFEVLVGPDSYGTFDYADLPVTVGPIPITGQNVVYSVRDNDISDCKVKLITDPVDCSTEPCHVFDLVVETGECHPDLGTYNLFLNFMYTGAPGTTFEVIYEGSVLGTFNLSDLPVMVNNVPISLEPHSSVTVCLTGAIECCATVEYPTPDCPMLSPVWPGDANSNNKTNNYDVLNLGLAFGFTGPERTPTSIAWEGFPAVDWDEFFTASNANFKHADANGDGIVDFDDLQAIESNYNLVHGFPMPEPDDVGNQNDPPLYFDLPNPGDVVFGEPFMTPLTLGSPDLPAVGMYGLAFTIAFDPAIFDPASVSIQFLPSWLGIPGQDLMVFYKVFPAEGLIDIAMVRIDQTAVSGSGDIANFVGIIDDVLGRKALEIQIQEVRGIGPLENSIPLQLPRQRIYLDGSGDALQLRNNVGSLQVFPNPTREWLQIRTAPGQRVQQWELLDSRGQQVRAGTGLPTEKISLAELPAGIYWIRIQTGEEQLIERILKQ